MKKHLLFLIVFFVGYVCNAQTVTAPASGSGSAEDPWQIASLENLYWIAADSGRWGYSYLQTADINAAVTAEWFDTKGWLPIGDAVTEFSGSYDGNGYSIDSLYINRTGEKNIGLFGLAEQAFLRNIILSNAQISGRINVGCLVGLAVNGTSVERCYTHGEVSVQDTCGGGMFGGLKLCEVNECYSSGTVTGSEDAWGVGGFSGATWMQDTWIGDCYSTCSVSGTIYVGGFVGINEGNVFHCYSNGNVTGSGEYIGGLIGFTDPVFMADIVTACFWDSDRAGTAGSSGGTGASSAEMKTVSTFTDAGWDFTDIWAMEESVNDGYPYLPWNAKEIDPIAVAPEAGDGSANTPFQISTLENLYWIAADSSRWVCHYIQTADIDATPTLTWFGGKGWKPIGNGNMAFTGAYNGQGHTIDHLFICDSLTDALGLFAISQTAIFCNLNMTNINIRGANAVGGLLGVADALTEIRHCHSSGIIRGECEVGMLLGWSRNSKILNCHTSGTVYGNTTNIGGLIGMAEESAIFNCYSYSQVNPFHPYGYCVGGLIGALYRSNLLHAYSSGDVCGGTSIGGQVGGLIGNSRESSVKCCYSTGNAIGVNCSGGLIGECENTLLKDCYSRGNVEGNSRIGGLAGLVYVNSQIENCYSTGSIQGVLSLAGGLIGERYDSPVTNSFWDTQTSGFSVSEGGEGKTTAEMNSLATFSDAGWDFTDIWQMDAGVNNAYPFLNEKIYSIPIVSTDRVKNISAASADLWGSILYLGDTAPTQYGVCWNTWGNPKITDNKTEEGGISVTGSYISQMTGLQANTFYYARSYATNAGGTAYGEIITFFTQPLLTTAPSGAGSEEDPYRIASLENLFWIFEDSSRWCSHCIQTQDIDASPTTSWFDGQGWLPFPQEGSYNGQGYVIDHLYINRPTKDYIGLFATASKVINLTLTNVNITGKDYVGSLAGMNNNFVYIDNCHGSGNVSGQSTVGGLIGWSQQSRVMNCSFNGTVNGNVETGGLVGANGMGSISFCYSSASVNGAEYIGGLTGRNWGGLYNSYSTGNVSGSAYIGGLSGAAVGSGYSPATIDRCYSAGHVSGDSLTGGLNGAFSLEFTTIINSFWDVETSGQPASAGGGTGKTSAEMKTRTTFSDSGWAFPDLWGMDNALNAGYPYLLWQVDPEPVIETLDIVSIKTDSAEVRYRISYLGLPFPVHGICVSDSTHPTVEGRRTLNGPADSTGDFISLLYPLESNTQYYVRAYATNTIGTFYGDILSFTTFENALPLISGLTVSNIDTASVLASAEIQILGFPFPVQHGFCWSRENTPTLENDKVELGKADSTGIFSNEIQGLLPNARYCIRAYATNAQGTAYSDTLWFTTLKTESDDRIPNTFQLAANYPNPFNPTTTIRYALPEAGMVRLVIYDIAGRPVRTLVHSQQAAGYRSVVWDGCDDDGKILGSGMYIYRLQANDFTDTKKMVLMK